MPLRDIAIGFAFIAATATAAPTDDARASLVQAAFMTGGKPQATALVNRALNDLGGILAKSPADHDALIQQGIGFGYRGQLTRSMGDAKRARDILAALVARNPNDPDAQISLGGWHLSVIADVGGFVGGTVLGANRETGLAALDRAVRLGGNRAFFPAYAGLLRIRLNPDDSAAALPLLNRAIAGSTPNELDRITQAAAKRVAAQLRAGNAKGASTLAKQLLPFGRVA